MTRDEARDLVVATATVWADDPATDVVWAGVFEGRPGLRMAQRVRDFTTVWFDVGDRTVRFEAFLLTAPPHAPEAAYRFCLARNWRSWPASIALDRHGDLFVLGRIPLDGLDVEALDMAVGAVHETVELAFRPLLRMSFTSREKTR